MAKMTGGLTIQDPDKKVVLVIDDDQMVRKLLKKVAKTLDLIVIESQDGKDAFQFLQEHSSVLGLPDLILVDIYMPNMDGISFCQNIKQAFSFPSNRIIIISAISQKEDLGKIHQLEEIDFIPKPFSIEQVRQTIKTKLEQPLDPDIITLKNKVTQSEEKLSNNQKEVTQSEDTLVPIITTNVESVTENQLTNDVATNEAKITKDTLLTFIEKLYSLNDQFFTGNPDSGEESQAETREHLHLGTTYFEMGLFDDAIEELLQAVKLAEEFHFYEVKFQSCVLLAQCFLYKESFTNSIIWLNNALEPMTYQQPMAQNLRYELGQLYQKLEKPTEALQVH